MHYLPDTDEQDALTEIYWPDDFKTVVRQELREAFSRKMDSPAFAAFIAVTTANFSVMFTGSWRPLSTRW